MSGMGRVIGTIFGRRDNSAKGRLRAAGLSDAERRALADGALATEQMGLLRGLPSARFSLAERGYSKAQVDRLFARLAAVPDDVARWRQTGDPSALDSLELCVGIPELRFTPEPMGYASNQVDAVLATLGRSTGPFAELIERTLGSGPRAEAS